MAIFEPNDGENEWRTSVPFTYNIDYAADHVGRDSYEKMIGEAPPVLLHVGHDVPFKSMYGPTDLYDCLGRRLLTPKEVEERIEDLKSYVSELHNAGVKTVIPYICSMFLFGNGERRTGFWEFYDNWERYSGFGFGSRPKKDPVTWSYERPRPLEMKGAEGSYVYEPCINIPDWRRFLRTVVGHIARVGYDGVFVDVNSSACTKACCRRLFREYLAARYTGKEIEKLFGFDAPGKVRLGRKGEGLLWVETVRFRGERMASLFAEFRNEGRRYRDTFIVLPNLSPFQHVDGVWRRVGNTHVFSSWARECPVIMFEEMQQPGLFCDGVVSNFVLQYKYAFAHRARAGCLLYYASDEPGVQIAMAEVCAGGGGAFIQGGYSCPEVRRRYRVFLKNHADLFEGYRPYSKAGLVFSYEQLAWGTRSHMENTYRIAEELMAKHVLFDIVAERSLFRDALRGYDALIAAGLENISDVRAREILSYVDGGGRLIATGRFGASDERGKRRRGGVLGSIPGSNWTEVSEGVRQAEYGKGECLMAGDLTDLLSPAPLELFTLTEEECNDTDKIFDLVENSKKNPEKRRRELVPQVRRMTGRSGISVCEETLRFNAYRRTNREGSSLVLHAVNYNLPIHGIGKSGPPIPATKTSIRLRLPPGFRAGNVEMFCPPEPQSVDMAFKQKGKDLLFEIPSVEIYSLIQIQSEP